MASADHHSNNRRPLKSRQTQWAAHGARLLLQLGLKPNQISILSVLFALIGGILLWALGSVHFPFHLLWGYMGATACIQLRLLCNLFDGMVAIEGGLKSKSGEIYNELPDRFADALFLVGSGYATANSVGITLGYIAALLAVITAYVRALGVVAGASQQFIGPMAKPHRMALLTVACILQGMATMLNHDYPVLFWALALIIVGCLLTIARRTSTIIRELESK